MTIRWQDFLSAQNITITPQFELESNLSTHSGFCPLTQQGLIKATGDEALAFLQNQFSNDVNAVDNGHSQLSSYSNHKGRMFAIFQLFMLSDSYYLRLPRTILEPTLKRLQMFVLRTKVTLSDESDDLLSIGLLGTEAEAWLQTKFSDLPSADYQAIVSNGMHLQREPSAGDARYTLSAPASQIQSLYGELSTALPLVSTNQWQLSQIDAGIPTIYPETREAFVPQMTNLELIDAVNFKKGCYPGQEVVARMHYLGKAKRRMLRIEIETDDAIAPNTPIVNATEGDTVGHIVESRIADNGLSRAITTLKLSEVATPLAIRDENGPACRVLELPYALPQDDD